MQLVASRDIAEPDLARIEAPFFACSEIRRLLLGTSRPPQLFSLVNTGLCARGLNRQPPEKLLCEIEDGSCFLVIRSGLGPLYPPVRWQPATHNDDDGHWVVDQSLSAGARFSLERAIARIEGKRLRVSHAGERSQIIPITGTPAAGIVKRYANATTGGHAFPERLTAAGEKGLGSRIRNLYGGNDTIRNQADIAAYNDKPSVLGVTHGQIFDAMETAVAVAGFFEGGLLLSRLAGAGKATEKIFSNLSKPKRVDALSTNTAKEWPEGAYSLIGANSAVIDPKKLTEYALNPKHPVGVNKAKVFESALGITRENANDLMGQLQRGVMENTPAPGKIDQFGTRFTIDIPVIGPIGNGVVRTGWIYKADSNVPELTTLFVK